ncbi:unnamed protein product [Camellia sinensis]
MGEEVGNKTINFLEGFDTQKTEFSDSVHPELDLGLSLGGFYAKIPPKAPLIRTSSMMVNEKEREGGVGIVPASEVVDEEEMRKLKEMQALKRMEAKKRMVEKLTKHRGAGGSDEEKPRLAAAAVTVVAKLTNWAPGSTSKAPAADDGFSRAVEELKCNVGSSTNLVIPGPENSTAGKAPTRVTDTGKSVDPGNYCSEPSFNFGTMVNGKLAYPGKPAPGIMLEKIPNGKTINPTNSHPPDFAVLLRKRANEKMDEAAKTEQERVSKKVQVLASCIHDSATIKMMKIMPRVTTTGNGPNGRKIKGLLYKYAKGHVSIVCVCHGVFLTPAEFVKHAGGSDVENPMKLINIVPGTL